MLRSKHTSEDPDEIESCKVAIWNGAQGSLIEPQGSIRKVDEYFRAKDVGGATKKVGLQSTPDLLGSHFSHFQDALSDDSFYDIADFLKLVFTGPYLLDLFWVLPAVANISAGGTKAWPIACGDVPRRTPYVTSCHHYEQQLADYSEP